jgi:gas vesicle protein
MSESRRIEMSNMNSSGMAGAGVAGGVGGFFTGMLVGLAVGGIVALLFAPQTGNETRSLVRDRWGQMRDVFRASKQDMTEMGEKTAEQMKRSAREMRKDKS